MCQKNTMQYIQRKKKCKNCKNLLSKYIINDNSYNYFKLLRLIYIFKILC